MRLLRLKIRNIASLKGEHEIDFVEIQRGSSLFAITGETGSGKSTILNSIGLALYGQLYKKNVNPLDVVTLGEKDGSIELIFQVKDKFYLADWRLRVLKQNGEPYATPQSATRNLYEIEGDDFSFPKNISEKNAPELLNLDFDQFCKCIILNQGEFARFLTSSFSERKDILEKLYPGELLDNISRQLENEKKTLEKLRHDVEIELQTLKGDIDPNIDLKSQKVSFESQLKVLEEKFSLNEKLDYHFVSLFTYFEKFTENERKKESITQDLSQETSKFNLLLKTGEALQEKFQEASSEYDKKSPELQKHLKSEEALRNLDENHSELKKKETSLLAEKKLLLEKLSKLASEEELSREKLQSNLKLLTLPLDELKTHRERCLEIIDIFQDKEVLSEEVKGKRLRLSELESTGKELKALTQKIEEELKALPPDAATLEEKLLQEKKDLQQKIDQKQRAELTAEEINKQLANLKLEEKETQEKISTLDHLINQTREEIFPLETTLKLQEVLNATGICLDHALTNGKDSCPVCETTVPEARWQELKTRLAATDLVSIRKKFDLGREKLFQSEKENDLFKKRLTKTKEELSQKEKSLSDLAALITLKLPSMSELEKELDLIRKKALEVKGLQKELQQKMQELQKTRSQYAELKEELSGREKLLQEKEDKLETLGKVIRTLLPVISKDSIRDLKQEMKHLGTYLEQESSLEKILQSKTHLTETQTKISSDQSQLSKNIDDLDRMKNELKKILDAALKGEKASDLIQKLNLLVKTTSEEWSRHKDVQKKQELILKDLQARLSQLEELKKDYDLQFTNELHKIRDLAQNSSMEKLKKLELSLTSPRELFIPLMDLIRSEKENAKTLVNECRMNFAAVTEKLSAWEKLQDKIALLELKAGEIKKDLDRKLRLSEVLGKDELRTFVLSLVEENLIHQTNLELQKLCQGRYEIIHQTKAMKMTPEFFILDKFREGGKRKVSTLSGGETFMVSLAMALGLAEMTRGQAEIDSLFIDEGFGTLDQESLEDVLDMLQQIQTRGLMVGIISHIKTLTNAIPVNLMLSKKQDGTSSVNLVLN